MSTSAKVPDLVLHNVPDLCFLRTIFHICDIRDVLIKFRIGASHICVHKMRYVALTPQDMLCPLCSTAYKDEMHILFYYKSLDDLRQKHIPKKYVVHPSGVTLKVVFMTWVDSSTIPLSVRINGHVHNNLFLETKVQSFSCYSLLCV